MFRMRRYRFFMVLAIIAVGALYHFTSLNGSQNTSATTVEGLKKLGQKVESAVSPPATEPYISDKAADRDVVTDALYDKVEPPIAVPSLVASGTPKIRLAVPEESDVSNKPTPFSKPLTRDATRYGETNTPTPTLRTPVEKSTAGFGSSLANKSAELDTGPADPVIHPGGEAGRLEIIADKGIPKIHWSQMPEHFPIPTENIIQLPTGKPRVIPKIQHTFTTESAEERTAREAKRDAIKKAFSFSWNGYKAKAWSKDELSPATGKYRNPFCAWGATLVDSLDTLWIMGLKGDFEEAVEAVKHIDFTTSPRNDIPLFETVIRYLGGLVAAYDISDGSYRILLDKALELADVLMGAFDTPNRMPMTFYLWKPTFASQPHRAKTRVVLAELGSLSLEFTRLAQITKETKYYDAVARITNELELWQNDTRLPGLWPQKVDASGCKKPDVSPQTSFGNPAMNAVNKPLGVVDTEAAKNPTLLDGGPPQDTDMESSQANTATSSSGIQNGSSNGPGTSQRVKQASTEINTATSAPVDAFLAGEKSSQIMSGTAPNALPSSYTPNQKRDINDGTILDPHPAISSKPPECEPQGLASPPFTSSEDFGIGGQADSTYEYLPKEYMLLGGLEDKYRSMYERAADSVTKNLLFRPMIPNENRRLLNAGLVKVTDKAGSEILIPEGTHLTCFAGGMYAIGAKIFSRDKDMDIARKLTDGCIWAYESTTTGIMPESYLAVPCPDPVDCPWNETLWHEKLDPNGDAREKTRLHNEQKVLQKQKEAYAKEVEEQLPKAEPTAGHIETLTDEQKAAQIDSQIEQAKAEQAVSKPIADTFRESQQPTDEEAVLNPLDGSVRTQPDFTPQEARADISDTKPTKDAVLPNLLVKRQLGELSDAPAAAPPVELTKEIVVSRQSSVPVDSGSDPNAAPAAETMENASVGNTLTEQATDKSSAKIQDPEASTKMSQDNVPWSRTANGTAQSASHTTYTAAAYSAPPTPTREEFVKARIRDERLPKGMTRITGPKYILRPEAIESVFIMYRATGDNYWLEKGWKMFEAVEKYTTADFGASAISDVTSETPSVLDEMESFWLAETLKYFYLLFSEPTLMSLDDYVVNTEAHPFKRPR